MDSRTGGDDPSQWEERKITMQSVKEIVQSIVDAMEETKKECDPIVACHFRRLALINYSQALKGARTRSREENERLIAEAHENAAMAVSCGTDEDSIEDSFAAMRAFWIPRLVEVKHAKD
jgi:hypothetical protein